MTPLQRNLRALPVLLACAVMIAITGNPVCVALPLVLALAALVLPPRLRASTAGELLLAVCIIWLAIVLTPGASELGALGQRRAHVLSFPFALSLLLLAGLRLHLVQPFGGLRVTLALGLPVLLVGGSTSVRGALFPLLAISYLLTCSLVLHATEAAWPAWRELGARHRRAMALILLLASALGSGVALSVPPLWSYAMRWALTTGSMASAASGFREGPLELGSLDGMLQSDEIVMRVQGERTDHLRGAVYSRYSAGIWSPELGRRSSRVTSAGDAATGTTVIRFADETLTRFFLPLGADEVAFQPGTAIVDATGILASSERASVERVAFRPGPRRELEVSLPSPRDLHLSRAIARELREIAAEWTVGAQTSEQRMDAITARLERDYRYSLHFERSGDRDDILDFLLRVRSGHCEYFASAAALLGRAADVPTRMVTGFRVHEWNPIGDYFVVRKRHAHAWVEAWYPDAGWVTVDPSPLESFEPSSRASMSLLAGSADFARARYEALESHQVFLLLIGVLAVSEARRRLREGSRRRASGRADGPPLWIEGLFRWLGRRGLVRQRGESLEQFARRSQLESPDAAALVGRYAALRYGDRGDADALARDVREQARER